MTLAVHRSRMGRDHRAGRSRRRAVGRGRCQAHRRRRADVRLVRQPGRPGMDDRSRRSAQATARIGPRRPLKRRWAPGGLVQYSQGKWYRENLAALADRTAMAFGRRAAVGRRRTSRRPLAHRIPGTRDRARRPGATARCRRRQPRPAAIPGPGGLRGSAGRLAMLFGDRPASPLPKRMTSRPTPPSGVRRCWPVSTRSVEEPAAHVLPLHRREDDSGWASADWRLRRGRIVLLEGDSPAGLRLPLDSISWRPHGRLCPQTSRAPPRPGCGVGR